MPIRSLPALFLLTVAALAPGTTAGQTPLGEPACEWVLTTPHSLSGARADYIRVGQLTGMLPVDLAALVRPSGRLPSSLCVAPRASLWPAHESAATRDTAVLRPVPARIRITRNSAYPRDRNNGVLWAGRGAAISAQGGIAFRNGGLRAAAAPVAAWSENRVFRTRDPLAEGFSRFAHPWHTRGIDFPQRFGDTETLALHPGDSYVRYDARAFSFGLSTEALWLGPARRNPVLMSNTAPGFPHLFAGTMEPLKTGIGEFDVQLAAGQLRESEHWDDDPENDRRLITVFALAYHPRWAPGLHLGVGRVYAEPRERGHLPIDRILLNLIDVPLLHVVPETGGNEIASIFARWVFPEVGFEAYGEWAREEDPESLSDFLAEPDYSQGYMLGAQKVIRGSALWWSFWGELTHLGPSTPVVRGRPDAPYYTSMSGGQGHTHRGQLLGAWIGPGSESQAAGIDVFFRYGTLGLYGERVRFDESTYLGTWARVFAESRHDTELTGGLRAALLAGRFEADFELGFSHRLERQFVNLYQGNWDVLGEHNLMLDLVISWRP